MSMTKISCNKNSFCLLKQYTFEKMFKGILFKNEVVIYITTFTNYTKLL